MSRPIRKCLDSSAILRNLSINSFDQKELLTVVNYYVKNENMLQRFELMEKHIFRSFSTNQNSSDNLVNILNESEHSIQTAMLMREDIYLYMKKYALFMRREILEIDSFLSKWLGEVFDVRNIILKEVKVDDSTIFLEKIQASDTVHHIPSMEQLHRRFTDGRRCFAMIHPR